MKTTNIDGVRAATIKLAKSIPLNFDKFGLVNHPFTNTSVVMCPNKDNPAIESSSNTTLLDLTDKNEAEQWIEYLSNEFKKMSILAIYYTVSDKYKLCWLKLCKDYLSEKDFAEYLADAWISAENPNGDPNVPIPELISWFEEYPKDHLMVEVDQKVYENIPDTITLYRGVGKNRNPFGLSYTASKEKAEWFQNRYSKEGCFMIALNVKKEDILVYFNTRSEDEYVVNTEKYTEEIKKQIP